MAVAGVLSGKETEMKTILSRFLLVMPLLLVACAAPTPSPTAESAPTVVSETAAPPETPAASETAPTAADWKGYHNDAFGLAFQYPAGWFGPEEYIADGTLRVEVGSDRVYPYGTDPAERVYETRNSYTVVLQYTQNDANRGGQETLQSLQNLADGEALADGRSLIIRVRALELGRWQGVESIATLSDSAQTEPVYARQVLLTDGQGGLLSVFGTPINVEIGGAGWREVYRAIDEANAEVFHQLVGSITIAE